MCGCTTMRMLGASRCSPQVCLGLVGFQSLVISVNVFLVASDPRPACPHVNCCAQQGHCQQGYWPKLAVHWEHVLHSRSCSIITIGAAAPAAIQRVQQQQQAAWSHLRTDVPIFAAAEAIAAGAELVNGYGELGNTELLRRFGFVEPANPHDCAQVRSMSSVWAAYRA